MTDIRFTPSHAHHDGYFFLPSPDLMFHARTKFIASRTPGRYPASLESSRKLLRYRQNRFHTQKLYGTWLRAVVGKRKRQIFLWQKILIGCARPHKRNNLQEYIVKPKSAGCPTKVSQITVLSWQYDLDHNRARHREVSPFRCWSEGYVFRI